MHARITPYRYDQAQAEDVERVGWDALLPALRRLPGFRGYTVTIDPRTPDRGYAITLWDTAEQAAGVNEALTASGYPDEQTRARTATFRVESEPAMIHRVAIHD
jgi:hypothetical protein